ncbi:MAG TPA: ATP-binding cassette domain-containing protein [Longimicrobiales bacterium]|nr:ATP-binding cassette domain-containing protein [Longimicrobiales bacterium]
MKAPQEEVLRAAIRHEIATDEAEETRETTRSGEPVIALEDITLSFDHPVLRGIDLEARKGETLLVLGESGIGKSTLLKLILRLLLPDSGTIRVFGHEIGELSFEEALDLRRKIGMVFQNAALFDSVNVFDNIAYPLRENTKMSEAEIEGVVRERLEFVNLDPDKVCTQLPGELSGGMKKRVGLARAIATDPDIVLYDEPTAGLDPLTVGTIGDLIRKLRRERGVTSIVVTHDIRAGFRVATRVNLIREGRIVFDGTPEEMIAQEDDYIQRFLSLS